MKRVTRESEREREREEEEEERTEGIGKTIVFANSGSEAIEANETKRVTSTAVTNNSPSTGVCVI